MLVFCAWSGLSNKIDLVLQLNDFAFRFNHFHIDLKILNSYMKNIIHRKQWMAQVILKFSFGCLLALFIKYKAKSGFYIYLDNKRIKCRICGNFISKANFTKHFRVHTGLKC